MSARNTGSAHLNTPRQFKRSVRYTGSDAIKEGQGFCYDIDYTDAEIEAADAAPQRDRYVTKPTPALAGNFAGVASANYAAKSGGQDIEIYEPGSVCKILCSGASGLHTAVGVTVPSTVSAGLAVACSCGYGDRGWFSRPSVNAGRGTATILQTKTMALCSLMEGDTHFCSWVAADKALVDDAVATGIFQDIEAGDLVWIMSGGHTTQSAAGRQASPGVYTVASKVSDTEIRLTESIATLDLNSVFLVITRDYPTVLAKLNDGPESGLQQWLQLENTSFPVDLGECSTNYIGANQKLAADVNVSVGAAFNPFFSPQIPKVAFHLHGNLNTFEFAAVVDGTASCPDPSDATKSVTSIDMEDNFDTVILLRHGRLVDGRNSFSIAAIQGGGIAVNVI